MSNTAAKAAVFSFSGQGENIVLRWLPERFGRWDAVKRTLLAALLLSMLFTLSACGRPAPAESAQAPVQMERPARPTAVPRQTPYPTATPRPADPLSSTRPYSADMMAPLPSPNRYIPATPTPTPKPTPVPLNPLGDELAAFALDYLGCEYRYGGKDPETGFDCSGLVYYVYGNFGIPLNRTAADMAKNGEHVPPEELQPGDILLFRRGGWIGHAGIYVGDGEYIHSMDVGIGVVLSPMEEIRGELEIRRVFAE